MNAERFYAGLELRAEGRRLDRCCDPVWGGLADRHRERFEAGRVRSSTTAAPVGWTWAHDPERVIAHTDGGGLELRDTHAERWRSIATLPRDPGRGSGAGGGPGREAAGIQQSSFTPNPSAASQEIRVVSKSRPGGHRSRGGTRVIRAVAG